MGRTEKILGSYCLFAMVAMYATGMVIRLTIQRVTVFTCIAIAAYGVMFFLLACLIFRNHPPDSQNPAPADPDDTMPEAQSTGDLETPDDPDGPKVSQESPDGPKLPQESPDGPKVPQESPDGPNVPQESPDGPKVPQESTKGPDKNLKDLSILELILESKRFRWHMIIAVLVLDILYLFFIMTKIPPNYVVSRLEVHISVWGTIAMALCFAAAFSDRSTGGKSAALVFGATTLHLFLTLVGNDLFASRGLAIVLAFCVVFLGAGLWRRLAGPLLAVTYFVIEALVVKSGIFAFFSELNWLNPLRGNVLGYDYALKIAVAQISGLWGMGRESLAGLDFARPDLMYLNGLPYLSALGGDFGVMAYAFLNISTLLVLGWFLFRRLKVPLAIIVLPFWCLTLVGQYFTLFCYMVFRTYGLTQGPAFIGGYETGMSVLILAMAILEPGSREVPRPRKEAPVNHVNQLPKRQALDRGPRPKPRPAGLT
ncbi:MAG: hypothetical protein LBF58_11325 [Deltaproteobacteria bacterium]|jgi:hypothetical protein|nr:hypothetical protein [Deltaproteobacteria bacterium]